MEPRLDMKNSICRRPSVDEWFLALQLKKIKQGMHIPIYVEADISHLISRDPPPYTAILIKAASHLIQRNPDLNKINFHGLFGTKIVEPNYNAVNLPVEVSVGDKKILTGISIQDAYKKSLSEIKNEIRLARNKTLNDLPVNKIIHGAGFDFWKKIKLRTIFFALTNMPSLYLKKHGGGISVSSLMNLAQPNQSVHINAFGMTTFTISSCCVENKEGKYMMKVGIAFDHLHIHGSKGMSGVVDFVNILQTPGII